MTSAFVKPFQVDDVTRVCIMDRLSDRLHQSHGLFPIHRSVFDQMLLTITAIAAAIIISTL